MKTCSKCKIKKPFEDFNKRKEAKDGHRNECRECMKAKSKAWYVNNREEALRKQKVYREDNKERVKAGRRKHYLANRESLLAESREYVLNNREAVAARKREWNKKNADRIAERKRQYNKDNRDRVCEWKKEYRLANMDRLRAAYKKWYAANYKPSPAWETKKYLPHTMYLIRFTQGNRTYIKPGITGRTIKERFSKDIYHSRMSNFEILDSITFADFETCNVAESIIHDATLDSHVTPVIAFVGSVNECRQPEALEQIISMFDSARAGLDNTN